MAAPPMRCIARLRMASIGSRLGRTYVSDAHSSLASNVSTQKTKEAAWTTKCRCTPRTARAHARAHLPYIHARTQFHCLP